MKNGNVSRLSVLGILLLFNLSAAPVYGQGQNQNYQPHNAEQFPTAQLTVRKESNSSWYEFNMHSEIPEWKADRLEERLVLRYPTLRTIEIDPIENVVVMEVQNSNDPDVVKNILYHFKYNGYEEI